ncbi:MAG: hypothetical protein HOJ67_16850 [Rhodospirillaceae bacterium]|jgi:hypothetical protein|nr:hypothetical protein [Rhodospirillales bacterium]MBT3904565.1 hypothetical protein [Rhodospirillaceae bacterium]MBT6218201.1 hypothetical protein [Rhodospirillaceae bacterium]MBT6363871.1 hypothetical protein [Rhodospirillaceae bacterium]MBT7486189.1 hypothetical protein [Rhodospirillales bacterium]
MTKAKARERAKANALKKKKKRAAAAAQPENLGNTGNFNTKSNNPLKPTGGQGGTARTTRGAARGG